MSNQGWSVRSVLAVLAAVVVFAILGKPVQVILSVSLIILFALIFGDSDTIAANAEAAANIGGLILALLAAYGTYRLIAKSKRSNDQTTQAI